MEIIESHWARRSRQGKRALDLYFVIFGLAFLIFATFLSALRLSSNRRLCHISWTVWMESYRTHRCHSRRRGDHCHFQEVSHDTRQSDPMDRQDRNGDLHRQFLAHHLSEARR